MRGCDEFIEYVKSKLPELATPRDLVAIGLYHSSQAAAMARQSGTCPDYFQINSKRILYPKLGVVEFLQRTKRST